LVDLSIGRGWVVIGNVLPNLGEIMFCGRSKKYIFLIARFCGPCFPSTAFNRIGGVRYGFSAFSTGLNLLT
jgi:hypothetical protein